MYSPVKYESFLVEANYGFDLRLMLSADGSGVPTSEKNLVIVGINKYGLLHIRTFDASGHRTDTDEANLSSTQVGTISTLKQRIKGLLPPRRLTVDESHQLISQVKSFVGLAHQDYFVRELMEAVAKVVHKDTGYEVTRVTSPPGYGKSALLRYLEQILYCDPRVQGSRPNRIREVLRCDERDFHIRDHFCSIKLDQLTSQFEVRSIMLDDLKNEDGFEAAAFNKLPAFDYDDHS